MKRDLQMASTDFGFACEMMLHQITRDLSKKDLYNAKEIHKWDVKTLISEGCPQITRNMSKKDLYNAKEIHKWDVKTLISHVK